jgi:hypothetical protein
MATENIKRLQDAYADGFDAGVEGGAREDMAYLEGNVDGLKACMAVKRGPRHEKKSDRVSLAHLRIAKLASVAAPVAVARDDEQN